MKILSHIQLTGRLKTSAGVILPYVHIGLILLLGMISYANSFDVPRQFDDLPDEGDPFAIGTDLYSLHGFLRNTRWVTDITFVLNRHLHGEQVQGFHLLNMAIHVLSAVAVYLIIRCAIEALRRTFLLTMGDEHFPFLHSFVPFTAAAFFICHPVQTQAVTYIAQRYTSLAAFFYLGSLLLYLLARLSYLSGSTRRNVRLWSIACVVLALLAMKCKEIAFTLPLMMAAFELALFRGELLKKRLIVALGAGLLIVIPLQLFITGHAGNSGSLLERMQLAAAETQTIARSDYLVTQFRVVTTYLRLLILPVKQNLDYDYPIYHSLFDLPVFASLMLHLALIGAAVSLFLQSKRQLDSGSTAAGIPLRLASLGIVWFYLALSVESSLIPIRDVIFEHRVYLPSVGFFLAAAACLSGIALVHRYCRIALWGAVILACALLTAGTISRNRIWASELTLWQDAVEKSPDKARPRLAVGTLYVRQFMPKNALPHYVRAVEIEPGWDVHWMNLNLTLCLLDELAGRSIDGSKYHATTVTVDPAYRRQWQAAGFNNLGLAYEFLGNLALARENYLKAAAVDPNLGIAWYNLALAAGLQHDTAVAAAALNRLKSIDPAMGLAAENSLRGLPR